MHICTHVSVFAIRERRREGQTELQRVRTRPRVCVLVPQGDRVQTELVGCRSTLPNLPQIQTALNLPAPGIADTRLTIVLARQWEHETRTFTSTAVTPSTFDRVIAPSTLVPHPYTGNLALSSCA